MILLRPIGMPDSFGEILTGADPVHITSQTGIALIL